MAILPTGKIIFYDQFGAFRQLDPVSGVISVVPKPWQNSFCGSMSMLSDGRLFVSGGGGGEPKLAIEHAAIYDPFNSTVTALPDMASKRWYNTTITLPTGDIFTAAGAGYTSPTEVWESSTNTWRQLPDLVGPTYLFPRLFVAPNGYVFDAGPADETYYFDTSGRGDKIFVADTIAGYRLKGSALMYDTGKVLAVGGSTVATGIAFNTAETIDLNSPNPVWKSTGSMKYNRKDMTLVLEPNGKVLAVGGIPGPYSDGQVLPTEEWDPQTGQWTVKASIGTTRGYHSTSLLLPDARIINGGAKQSSYQILTPGYLQNGPRPTIATAPSELTLGDEFDVTSNDASVITHLNMIRMASTTHAVNYDQRILKLPFVTHGQTMHCTLGTNPNVAIPGYYMLFALNAHGVPSIAKIIQIKQKVIAPPSLFTARASSPIRVRLHWTDNSSAEDSYVVSRSTDGVHFVDVATLPKNTLGYMEYPAQPSSNLSYIVHAVDAGGARHSSPVSLVHTLPLTKPGIPDHLSAKVVVSGSVGLTWTDTDDLEDGFAILRSDDGKTFVEIGNVGRDVTSFVDRTVTPLNSYFYRVVARNSLGASSPSVKVAITAR